MTGFFNSSSGFSLSAIQALQDLAETTYISIADNGAVQTFSNKYDGTVAIDYTGAHTIVGTDSDGYTWMTDFPAPLENADAYFNYSPAIMPDYLPYVDTRIDTVTGPSGGTENALYMEYKQDYDEGGSLLSRNQFNLNNDPTASTPADTFETHYFKYDMKFHQSDPMLENYGWVTFLESKMYDTLSRWGVFMVTTRAEPYWLIKFEDAHGGGNILWSIEGTQPVPYDQWVTLEVNIVHSHLPANNSGAGWVEGNGRFSMAIDGVVILDVKRRNILTAFSNLTTPIAMWHQKVYGNSSSCLYTNYEVWDRAPATSVLANI